MKQLKPWQLAFTFIGCFLGAGFVSGQELWQFFGVFGADGLFGAALASMLLCVFSAILMIIARRTGISDMEAKSVIKKFKDKKFAAGCSRDVIQRGADMLEMELNTLIAKTLEAMKA